MDATQLINQHIAELKDWRATAMVQLRTLVLEAAPGITEEWKWGTPVWSQDGNVVAAGAFKDHVKLNFFKGASLSDPHGLFNAGLEAKATRAIDIREGDAIDEAALKALVREAVALNSAKPKASKASKAPAKPTKPAAKKAPAKPTKPAAKKTAKRKK
jgi:hypothetical protein